MSVTPVPSTINGLTFRRETPAGTVRVVINAQDGAPFEVFILLGRGGSEAQSFTEGLGRLISLLLRVPSDLPSAERLKLAAEQCRGIGGAHQVGFGRDRVLSVVDAVGQVLDEYAHPVHQAVERASASSDAGSDVAAAGSLARRDEELPALGTADLTEAPMTHPSPDPSPDLCWGCGAPTLVREEGCLHCRSCGASRC